MRRDRRLTNDKYRNGWPLRPRLHVANCGTLIHEQHDRFIIGNTTGSITIKYAEIETILRFLHHIRVRRVDR